MQYLHQVEKKLEQFIAKFYVNELIKGALLFTAFGLLYFFLIVLLEFFFWLDSFGRSFLFFAFIAVEIFLLVRFIAFPLLKWAKISKGINNNKAAKIIGQHFPEVDDRLTNLLQLKDELSKQDSAFIQAAIEQKSAQLSPIPFQLAINFKTNVRYLPYALFPLLLLLGLWISGKISSFSESYNRVVDYKTYYAPPAPFQFVIKNKELQVEGGKSFTLEVSTQGEVSPAEIRIDWEGQSYVMKPSSGNTFQYTFSKVNEPIIFQLNGGGVNSPSYQLSVVEVPRIRNFELEVVPPTYTKLPNERLLGSGNATFPEGSQLRWKLQSVATNQVELAWKDSLYNFVASSFNFELSKQVFTSGNYQLLTSNANRKHYEQLSYRLQSIKDTPPKIVVNQKLDSVNAVSYYKAKAEDDYGLKKAQLVYYPSNQPTLKSVEPIEITPSTVADFFYTFPNPSLQLKEGEAYTYYFEVFDNDVINGSKSARSNAFSYRKNTASEERREQLQRQSQSLQGMQESFDQLKEEQQDANEIQQLQKEKNKLSFSDKKKIESYIERQKQQRELMKKFTQDLKQNLEKFQPETQDPRKEDLQNRLEENEKRLQDNQDLLDELQKYKDKINEEDLKDKLDNFSNESKKQERTLEQLLELTKRYYVEQKAKQIAEDLKDLSEVQEKLSEKNASTDEQSKINDAFEELRKELGELEQENKNLKKPIDLYRDEYDEKDIQRDLDKAKKALEDKDASDADSSKEKKDDQKENNSDDAASDKPSDKNESGESGDSSEGEEEDQGEDDAPKSSPSSGAKEAQKSAAQKMKEMAQQMGMSMAGASAQQQAEDADMLRQILSNLVIFSFEQEALMQDFKRLGNDNPIFASKLRNQAELRENFKHIDDSLYSLALRNQMITEEVTTKITDIQYHTNLALERLADNKVATATSNQQYVMTFSNDLANMLDSSLDQMQQQMSGSGDGQGSGEGEDGSSPSEQLSDIIKSFDDLKQEMQGQGQAEGEGEGEGDSEGDGGKEGDSQSQSGDGDTGANSEGNGGEEGNDSSGEEGKNDGEGSYGESEQMSEQLYEIYKKQQQIKDQLEDKIQELGLQRDSRNLNKSLDMLEREMLMFGFNERVQRRMEEVKHQLLKLQKSAQKQGEDNKREANTNFQEFTPPSLELDKAKEYFNTIEILNRQQLPLQPKYQPLIKSYFNEDL